MKKLILILLVLAAGLAILYRIYAIRGSKGETKEGVEQIQQRDGFPVRTASVRTDRFEVWRDIHGKVSGSVQSEINTTDPARVAEVKVKVGDAVSADQVLILLDKGDPRDMTRINLLKKVYDEAESDYNSYQRVYQAGGVSKDVVDKMRLNMESAKTGYESAKSFVEISSPIAGVVTILYPRVGERVAKDKTLAVVSNLDQVRIEAKISESDAAVIETGQPALVALSDGSTAGGKVDRIGLAASDQNGLFDLELLVSNPDRKIKAGTYTTARVRVFESEGSAWVDSMALMTDLAGSYYAWQIKEGQALRTPVAIKAQNDEAAVVEGLDASLPVVIEGMEQLKDGVKVLIVKPEPGAESGASPEETRPEPPGGGK